MVVVREIQGASGGGGGGWGWRGRRERKTEVEAEKYKKQEWVGVYREEWPRGGGREEERVIVATVAGILYG
jgi:hypothetical protein